MSQRILRRLHDRGVTGRYCPEGAARLRPNNLSSTVLAEACRVDIERFAGQLQGLAEPALGAGLMILFQKLGQVPILGGDWLAGGHRTGSQGRTGRARRRAASSAASRTSRVRLTDFLIAMDDPGCHHE